MLNAGKSYIEHMQQAEIRQYARKLTRLKTKREIVDKALELLVRSETRKGRISEGKILNLTKNI